MLLAHCHGDVWKSVDALCCLRQEKAQKRVQHASYPDAGSSATEHTHQERFLRARESSCTALCRAAQGEGKGFAQRFTQEAKRHTNIVEACDVLVLSEELSGAFELNRLCSAALGATASLCSSHGRRSTQLPARLRHSCPGTKAQPTPHAFTHSTVCPDPHTPLQHRGRAIV